MVAEKKMAEVRRREIKSRVVVVVGLGRGVDGEEVEVVLKERRAVVEFGGGSSSWVGIGGRRERESEPMRKKY